MSSGNNQLRKELDAKFHPPVDVLLDPSLLVARRSLQRLTGSKIFESQTQATLGGMPTKPRIGNLYVPATFRELLESGEQQVVENTRVWSFYRGQAEATSYNQIIDSLDRNSVTGYSVDSLLPKLQWEEAIDNPVPDGYLQKTLNEECEFLRSGGLVLSRTPTFVKTLRDTGLPTVDIGNAPLDDGISEKLADIGYRSPASVCVFGVSTAGSTVDALVGDILSTNTDMLLYRLGA